MEEQETAYQKLLSTLGRPVNDDHSEDEEGTDDDEEEEELAEEGSFKTSPDFEFP